MESQHVNFCRHAATAFDLNTARGVDDRCASACYIGAPTVASRCSAYQYASVQRLLVERRHASDHIVAFTYGSAGHAELAAVRDRVGAKCEHTSSNRHPRINGLINGYQCLQHIRNVCFCRSAPITGVSTRQYWATNVR